MAGAGVGSGRAAEPEVVVLSSTDDEFQPQTLRGAASSAATATTTEQPLRRSTRNRTQTRQFVPMLDDPDAVPVPRRRRRGAASSSNAPPVEDDDEECHLDQIELEEGGNLKMRVHPCAASLMHLHVHLSKTEVIGYLGGFVLDDGTVEVAEAFPATCVEPKEMTRSGRSAYREVEMQPESDVSLRIQITEKGLNVVGWYHSHPDKKFTVDPSRVDIENQSNYQQLIFKGTPFVAVILAPYNEDLPDTMGAMDCFYVDDDGDTPYRVPYTVEYTRREAQLYDAYRRHLGDRLLPDVDLETQAVNLIVEGAKFRQRVHLLAEWRSGVRYLDKLHDCLVKVLPASVPEGIVSGDTVRDSEQLEIRTNNERLSTLFEQFVSLCEQVWPESPQKKAANSKKRKRKGK